LMATHREAEDLINIGAYVKGSNPKIDMALKHIEQIRVFLRQPSVEKSDFNGGINQLITMMNNSQKIK